MIFIAVALAAEIGAHAPAHLRPCAAPVLERLARPGDLQYERMTHIRRIAPTCQVLGPISSFAEPGEEIATTYQSGHAPEDGSLASQAAPGGPDAPEVQAEADAPREGEARFFAVDTDTAVIPNLGTILPIPAVPEPATGYLLAAGLLALLRIAR